MIFLPKRRPILPEVAVLVLLAVVPALLINLIRPHGLPLFQNWTETRVARNVTALDMVQALALHADGDVLFLDSRSFAEYASTHIPGAASLPLDSVRDSGEPLLVIAYCGNEQCAKAETLAATLAKRGVRFVFLPEGISGWLSAGGPLEGK